MSYNPNREPFQVLGELLKVFGNFSQDLAYIEKQYGVSVNDFGEVIKRCRAEEMFNVIDEGLRKAYWLVMDLSKTKNLNIFTMNPSEKLVYADNFLCFASKFENALGEGRSLSRPQLSREVHAHCYNKNYRDTVTNGVSLLEDKLREKIHDNTGLHGIELIDSCFNPKTGQLILGNNPSEREGVYFLFRGVFQYFRNPPSHTIKMNEGSDSATKIMYMIDYLLTLVQKSKISD